MRAPVLKLVAFAAAAWAFSAQAPVAAADGHWAFQPLSRVEPPAGEAAHPVDRFIRATLAGRGLAPAPAADRRTLIRRLSFDLTGLPPSPEEVDPFLADSAPDAVARLTERLLASPHYGERWGRWWLDAARYADTNGQDENKVMANAWRYRDWVVRAFNADTPFDQFTVEQLAGDLLPAEGVSEETVFDRWTATGLLVLGPKLLAEQDKPKLVMDVVDEQIDMVSRTFLGLTVSCARCHDHKFDPIPARDYYALAGIFKSTRTMENLDFVSKFNERRITTQSALAAAESHAKALAAKTEAVQSAIRAANDALTSAWRRDLSRHLAAALATAPPTGPDAEIVKKLAALVAADPASDAVSRSLRDLAASPEKTTAFLSRTEAPAPAGNALRLAPGRVGAAFDATGANHLELPHSPALDPPQLTVETWVRATSFPKDGDPRRWLVNKNANEWVEGHYAILLSADRAGAYLNIGGGKENVFSVWTPGPVLKAGQWHHLAFTYDGASLRLFVDGQPAGETAINRPRVPGQTPLALGVRQDGYLHFQGRLDEARVFDHALTAEQIRLHFSDPSRPPDPGAVARWEFNDLSAADREMLAGAEVREALFGSGGALALPADPRPLHPQATRDAIATLERERDALKSSTPPPPAFALAVADAEPVDLPVHIRGSHLTLEKEPVPRGFIRAASCGAPPAIPPGHSGRLQLARWLTSAENPLVPRVIVNRVWQAHFGEGLVRTPDNFGLRGEAPSHPQLLDWLAREFIRSGWSVKSLHRLILSSATWQQRTRPAAAPPDADPEDRLLSHFPRLRLEAEMIRDSLLSVSGRLDPAMGGSLTAWKNNEYTPADEVTAASLRRTLYLPVVRDRVTDVLTIFDFANPSVTTARRTPTVVSHQALFLMNSPLVRDSARAFASLLLATPAPDDAARVQLAYQRALCRPATAEETARALRFLTLATTASGKSGDRTAAWAAFCQALFAANEFIYLE